MNTSTLTRKWTLKHKTTGEYLTDTYTYTTREAARKAAKGRRFDGLFTVARVPSTKTKRSVQTYTAPVTPTVTSSARKLSTFKSQGKSMTRKQSGSFPIAKARSLSSMGKLSSR